MKFENIIPLKEIDIATGQTKADFFGTEAHFDDYFSQFALLHDLREPVRMVGVYAQLLERKLMEQHQLDKDCEEYLQFIREGATRLNKMIEGMTYLAEAGKSPEAVQETDIEDVLYFVQKNLKLAIEERKASISILGRLPKVQARYSEMVRLFQNLLENSLKFSHPERQCAIKIQGRAIGKMGIIEVLDNGIGIPKAQHYRVFQPFQHNFSGMSKATGSGIGLALCKKLVEQYGGSISFDSTENEGTTFRIALPLAP